MTYAMAPRPVSPDAPPAAGDVLFYAGTSWQDGLIQWATWGPFSHCEVALSATESVGALSTAGVVRHPLPPPASVARVGATLAPERRDAMLHWLEGRVGTPYSTADIVADAVRALLPRWLGARTPFLVTPARYDCSELVALALLVAGVALPPPLVEDVHRCSPNDLAHALGVLPYGAGARRGLLPWQS